MKAELGALDINLSQMSLFNRVVIPVRQTTYIGWKVSAYVCSLALAGRSAGHKFVSRYQLL
jgi:hypothetical protein